jgi:hypothetical protein
MPNSSSPKSKRSYTPRGIAAQRVDVGFMPGELDAGRLLAAERNMSHAAFVRAVYLVGLPHYLKQEGAEAPSA